jgi:hypothetical protein
MKRYLLPVAALSMCGMANAARAANVFWTPRQWGGSYLYITGKIVPGDEQTFASLNPRTPLSRVVTTPSTRESMVRALRCAR